MTDTPLGWTPADVHADEIAFRLELMRSEKGVGRSAFGDLLRRIADDYASDSADDGPVDSQAGAVAESGPFPWRTLVGTALVLALAYIVALSL